ncbi:putative amidoligase enzyme-domain-containing protein [Diplogelasinospora grovesii]|uniref:Amidoligase enzyme-domain-containing protein n=1 Tax=Diplogelasinospora grovesii TaxID=303347 RepID=A0AAN6MWP2_9PEZI|nr:putative amidoligase enzyme-domain-containing protein [Diplogelasinospora grovesii]
MWGSYHFGVEIELIAAPHQVRHPLLRAVYYEKLAAALRSQGAQAVADRLEGSYGKHPEHYDKWWITKDGSLGNPDHPLIPLEAVSPILNTAYHWERDVDTFWNAWNRVFRMPNSSRLCGSHVHVSPSPSKRFTVAQLQSIAFGVIHYENEVMQLLPWHRQENDYCQPNSEHSVALQEMADGSPNQDLRPMEVWDKIRRMDSRQDIRDLMQHRTGSRKDRYVLWNFDNVLDGKSGSVEFRGGRGLRGPVRTKRWIAFVVAFAHFCIRQNFHSWLRSRFRAPNMQQFWTGLLNAAQSISVKDSLPSDWQAMAEMMSDGLNEGLCDFDDSDSDKGSMMSKSDSEFTESDYSDGDLEADFEINIYSNKEHY